MKKGFVLIGVAAIASAAGTLFASGTVWSEVKDNVAYVHHDDAYFNCCPEFVTWSEHDSSDYYVINIFEQDTVHDCDCMCYFDFEHVLKGLDPGTYTALVWEAPWMTFSLAGTTEFVIPVQMGSVSTSGSVSDCHEEPGLIESPLAEGTGFATATVTTFEIRYSLMETSRVTIAIFDAAGRKVRTFDEGMMGRGEHSITWNCRDDRNVTLSRGIYFVRLATRESVRSLPLIVLK